MVHEAVSVEPDIPAAAEVASVLVQAPTLESKLDRGVRLRQTNPSPNCRNACACRPSRFQSCPLVVEIQEAVVAPVEKASIPVESVNAQEPVVSAVVAEVSDEPVAVSAGRGPVSAPPTPSEPVADENLKILWEDGPPRRSPPRCVRREHADPLVQKNPWRRVPSKPVPFLMSHHLLPIRLFQMLRWSCRKRRPSLR